MRVLILVFFLALIPKAQALSDYGTPDHPLFTEDAGFHTFPVGIVRKDWLRPAVNYWNARAGFEVLAFSDEPLITAHLDEHCRSCALAYTTDGRYSMWGAYASCNISEAWHKQRRTVDHEVAHCLGLMHQHQGVMDPERAGQRITDTTRAFDAQIVSYVR